MEKSIMWVWYDIIEFVGYWMGYGSSWFIGIDDGRIVWESYCKLG